MSVAKRIIEEEWESNSPEPPPCWETIKCHINNHCAYCDAPPGQCWWGGEVIKFEEDE